MTLAIVVRWTGPYSFEAASAEKGSGLYMAHGRNRYGRAPDEPKLLYLGISEDRRGVGARIKAHRDDHYAHPENEWWVGSIVVPHRATREHLEAAEWMYIHFEHPEANQRKRVNLPRTATHLISEWFKPNGDHIQRQRGGARALSDALSWWPKPGLLRWSTRMQHQVWIDS